MRNRLKTVIDYIEIARIVLERIQKDYEDRLSWEQAGDFNDLDSNLYGCRLEVERLIKGK